MMFSFLTTTLTTAGLNGEAVQEAKLAGTTAAASGVKMMDLFINADIVVQTVMVLLLFASVWTWTLIFAKTSELRAVTKAADSFEDVFWSGQSWEEIYKSLDRPDARDKMDPLRKLFVIGMSECNRNVHMLYSGQNHSQSLDVQDRVNRLMTLGAIRESENLEKHMTFLASVGSTAPFIGLFGTVWGIMNSFQGIALSGSTNLAVVAPGIAEALFATAIGLIAAIPAVLGFNKISSEINKYNARLDGFVDEFSTLLSRKVMESNGPETAVAV